MGGKKGLQLVQPEITGRQEKDSRLAKFSPPRRGNRVLVRDRILLKVEDYLSRGHLWLGGPPGAGKTILAAGVADQWNGPFCWYVFDQLDTDPVSFFSTFPFAFGSIVSRNSLASLPVFHPEAMSDILRFARKFFRSLFSTLPEHCLVVLDDLHEIPVDSPLHDILAICLEELETDCVAFLLSRKVPPPSFIRLKVNGLIRIFDAEQLCFTRREIEKVAVLHGIVVADKENCVQYLATNSAGWAAGLTLLLEEFSHGRCGSRADQDLDHQELFDYFAGVIFAGLRNSEKEILIGASLLPEIRPATLDQMLGRTSTRTYFQKLSRNSFFTYSLDSSSTMFRFHPLFRAFLSVQAAVFFAPAVLSRLQRKAVDILVSEQRVDEAVDLLLNAKKWHVVSGLIKKIGMRMLQDGLFATLSRWQKALPRTIIDRDPWLLYFFGNAAMAYAPNNAIKILEKSVSLFHKEDDRLGALLSCSSLTNAIINHLCDLSLLDPWLDFLEDHLDPQDFPKENTFENVCIANAIFRGMVLRRPSHPELEQWLDVVLRMGGMHPAIITHYLWTGRFSRARSALDHIYAHQNRVGSKLQLSAIQAMEAQYYLIMNQPKECVQVIDKALAMIEETGIRVWKVHFLILGAGCCLNAGETGQGRKYLQAVEKHIDQARLLERSYYHVVKTLESLQRADLVNADHHSRTALDMATTIGMPSYDTWCWYGSALVAVCRNDCVQAMDCFNRVFSLAAASGNPWFTCQAHLGLAWMYLRAGQNDQALQHLEQGLNLAQQKNYLSFFFFLQQMMEELARAALEAGIVPDFVCRCIRRWQLVPVHPPLHLEQWPWPVKIYTLGRFSVLCNGEQIFSQQRKQKNRSVQLLQALISLGGRQVSKTRLANLFWPDSEGDEQAAALKITLYRLRKMLGCREAVQQQPAHISLHPGLCWVDSWLFERSDRNKALELYHGDFLEGFTDDSWMISYRERLRKRFVRLSEEKKTAQV